MGVPSSYPDIRRHRLGVIQLFDYQLGSGGHGGVVHGGMGASSRYPDMCRQGFVKDFINYQKGGDGLGGVDAGGWSGGQ